MARKAKKKTAARRKTTRGSKKTGEVLVVGSKVKALLKKRGCNTGGDAISGLNMWLHWLVDQSASRAKANGRKTVRAHDFISM